MKRPRILVVDDEPHLVSTVEDIFSLEGWETSSATNGREAVHVLERQPSDVVLMDIRMPEMNGLEAISEMERIQPGIPIILMTAFSRMEVIRHAVQENAIELESSGSPSKIVERLDAAEGRVAVIDARREILDGVALIQRDRDVDVRRTRSPGVAVRLLSSHRPVLVLLESTMPRIDGAENTFIVRRPTPAVVVLLARLTKDDATQRSVLKESPVHACLSKPFHPERLVREVREVLALQKV